MILTQCAVCAADLGLTLGKKCGRCSTRYCGAACQVQHWKEGGHDQLCKIIKKAGGAEQYNANKKYTEAVSVAVEKCAEDTNQLVAARPTSRRGKVFPPGAGTQGTTGARRGARALLEALFELRSSHLL